VIGWLADNWLGLVLFLGFGVAVFVVAVGLDDILRNR
jgi:hypothetical protein